MFHLKALKEIPGSVSYIVPGQHFIELDEQKKDHLIKTGFAELFDKPEQKKALNRRGWSELLWDNYEVVIMASGPSMMQEQADAAYVWRDRAPSRKAIVVNTTFRLAPWSDILYACDARWWLGHAQEVNNVFSGERWTQDKGLSKEVGMHVVESQRLPGLGRKPGTINQGANSGYQALNIAYQAGVRKVILLGFDMKPDGKKTHWHGDHPAPMNSSNPYRKWVENFDQMAQDLKDDGVEVVNATASTALACFKKVPWEEALAS